MAGARAASLVSAIRSFQQQTGQLSPVGYSASGLQELLALRGVGVGSLPPGFGERPDLAFLDFGESGEYGTINFRGVSDYSFERPSDRMIEDRPTEITAFQLSVPNLDTFESVSARAQRAAALYDSSEDFVVIVDVSDGILDVKSSRDIFDLLAREDAEEMSVLRFSGYVLFDRSILARLIDSEMHELLMTNRVLLESFIKSLALSINEENQP